MNSQQLIISGVGGQGILFITRLLAETAIAMGLSVLTSETHGMAQRGGIVISHLKVGDFSSPLVRSGQADGLIALKPANVALHRLFLRPGAWIAANSIEPGGSGATTVDADGVAMGLGNPQAVNLIVLGRALSTGLLFCTPDDVTELIRRKLQQKPALLEAALAAFAAGITTTPRS
ncbi:MAG: indolepyruvate oxidoreductase subunit beta [Desulfuromonadaceae bacterium]|nr:indolepyruvate oxidoreductase subunit beta [Desulfuromonadaceae bacterium]